MTTKVSGGALSIVNIYDAGDAAQLVYPVNERRDGPVLLEAT